jgi:uncharacterized protein (DUF1800 family)
MSRDPQSALVALNRFGFGARGGASGDFLDAVSDPRGFVKAELVRPGGGALIEAPELLSTAKLAQQAFAYQRELKQARQAAAKEAAEAAAAQGAAGTQPEAAKPHAPKPLNVIQKTYRTEALARLQRAVLADCGFSERLVAFWSNHFCISATKGPLARIWAGAFEREAIRPHVLGRFVDMLMAVGQHPAMLFYLDNQQSVGPDSRAGRRRKRGLNENLARETMELHTIGVDGGYTQADVTSLSRILTGWTFVGPKGFLGEPGSFVFNANAHEPGPQRLLGKVYPAGGLAQGEAALADLARHPATARFIAIKFAGHFVADDPPPALVARLADVFTRTDGDLKALTLALVDSDEAWHMPLTKIRSPYEYLVATGRLLDRVPENPGPYLGGLNMLGEPLWSPPAPNGFSDTNAAWAAPEGMKLRLDIATRIGSHIGNMIDPRDLVEFAFGNAVSPDTRLTVARAATRQQAVALLLMSPEFQRR